MGLAHLARGRVDVGDRGTGEVDEHLLPGPVVLTHHHVELLPPLPVPLAEPAVLVPVRVGPLVLHPQQLQGHALAPQLRVDPSPVRFRAAGPALGVARVQQRFQRRIVQVLGQRPAQAGCRRPVQKLADRAVGYAQAAGDLPHPESAGQMQPQHLPDPAHRQPPPRHGAPVTVPPVVSPHGSAPPGIPALAAACAPPGS